MTLHWTRSDEGYTETKCGRFRIEPIFNHATTPQGYTLYDGSERVRRSCFTQADAKALARRIVEKEESDARTDNDAPNG